MSGKRLSSEELSREEAGWKEGGIERLPVGQLCERGEQVGRKDES